MGFMELVTYFACVNFSDLAEYLDRLLWRKDPWWIELMIPKKEKQINHGSELWFLLWILFSVGDCGFPSSVHSVLLVCQN